MPSPFPCSSVIHEWLGKKTQIGKGGGIIFMNLYNLTAPSCYLDLLDRLQKRICRTVGPSLATSREPLARRNVASLSLFYRY